MKSRTAWRSSGSSPRQNGIVSMARSRSNGVSFGGGAVAAQYACASRGKIFPALMKSLQPGALIGGEITQCFVRVGAVVLSGRQATIRIPSVADATAPALRAIAA